MPLCQCRSFIIIYWSFFKLNVAIYSVYTLRIIWLACVACNFCVSFFAWIFLRLSTRFNMWLLDMQGRHRPVHVMFSANKCTFIMKWHLIRSVAGKRKKINEWFTANGVCLCVWTRAIIISLTEIAQSNCVSVCFLLLSCGYRRCQQLSFLHEFNWFFSLSCLRFRIFRSTSYRNEVHS